MNKTMVSIMNLHDFRDENSLSLNPNGDSKFKASISYTSPRICRNGTCFVRLVMSGYDGGTLHIDEAIDFDSNGLHLDFDPKWQSYNYNKTSKTLIIDGSSQRMGGKYQVIITKIDK